MSSEIKDRPDNLALQKYYCSCCGKEAVSTSVDKVESEDPEMAGESWTRVGLWCYECSDWITMFVEVPKKYEPHPDIGSRNVMNGLTRHLRDKAVESD